MHAFLSQIFDYGNTAIEKRAIFYKRLPPLLEFGRERSSIDLSKVILTHHNLKNQGKRALALSQGETSKLKPLTEAGAGIVREDEAVYLSEIIDKVKLSSTRPYVRNRWRLIIPSKTTAYKIIEV